ncbi:hypothetical protein DH2020_023347 [Rehmannia glutinosa]|uniref:WRKY domain-containing protein n=1 Tax=Rehmannia glutinosa TaxID=99300 RepID=A0ABR0WA90_REHGL
MGFLHFDDHNQVAALDPKTINDENCSEGGHSWWRNSNKINKVRRKLREPRFCFQTRSDVDVLDDGYKWRKYGQKVVKNSLHPRSYYRCTHSNCRVKKRVERLSEDCRMIPADTTTANMTISETLALVGSPMSDDELIHVALKGLGPEYKPLNASIRARDTLISFEELHDKLADFEMTLKCNEAKWDVIPITA